MSGALRRTPWPLPWQVSAGEASAPDTPLTGAVRIVMRPRVSIATPQWA